MLDTDWLLLPSKPVVLVVWFDQTLGFPGLSPHSRSLGRCAVFFFFFFFFFFFSGDDRTPSNYRLSHLKHFYMSQLVRKLR